MVIVCMPGVRLPWRLFNDNRCTRNEAEVDEVMGRAENPMRQSSTMVFIRHTVWKKASEMAQFCISLITQSIAGQQEYKFTSKN